MKRKHTGMIAAGAAVALSAAIAVPTLTSAQSPQARTITVQEKVQNVAADDLPPRSKRGPTDRVSLGDRLITRQSLFDTSRKRIGTLYTDCTGVGPTRSLFKGATLLCTVSYKLSDGQIVAAGAVELGDDRAEVPIVGGTGAYAGARGTVKMAKPAKGFDSADVITITG
ncbi:MAG: hypothetical protein WKF48_11535 [Solirubrobacteraceae bacterium]